jgi:hypothetical protein
MPLMKGWCDCAMKAVQSRLIYPELRIMPEGEKRYELIDGEV